MQRRGLQPSGSDPGAVSTALDRGFAATVSGRPAHSPTGLSRSDVMRAEAVAELLGISRRTVYEWARQGRLPCRRRGKVVLFVRPQIEAWLLDPKSDF